MTFPGVICSLFRGERRKKSCAVENERRKSELKDKINQEIKRINADFAKSVSRLEGS